MGARFGTVPDGPLRWEPLRVDIDDILECPPDCKEDAYKEDRLLWLSESLCFGGDCGFLVTPVGVRLSVMSATILCLHVP